MEVHNRQDIECAISEMDWQKVRETILHAMQSMRAPPTLQSRRLGYMQVAANMDVMSNFAAEAMREFHRRQFQPSARDVELEALADTLITQWQASANKMLSARKEQEYNNPNPYQSNTKLIEYQPAFSSTSLNVSNFDI